MPKPSDPFAAREQQKYANPIPSREFIIAHLRAARGPVSRQQLFKELGLAGDDHAEALRRRLRAMERDGQVVFTRGKTYALPEKMEMLRGQVLGHRDGFGFFRPDTGGDDLFLPEHEMRALLHGDQVLVQQLPPDRRGRMGARVVRVLEPRSSQIVGRYFKESELGFVQPDDNRLAQDIIVPPEERGGARHGQIVVVEVIQRPTRRYNAVGRVVEVLGEPMAPGMEIDIALRNHELPHQWPEGVLSESARYGSQVPHQVKRHRTDLRNLPLVTIDGEDARDFDDAVYCQAEPDGGWRLWVAIADVSYYVRPGQALDQEAFNRGNSVYFPSQVIPMLPEALSNGLCSLNPQVDRLCLVCEMVIGARGKLRSYRFFDAVMKSHARFTYTKVAAILDGDKALREQYAARVAELEELHRLYRVLKLARRRRGAIEFESQETRFVFNQERRIERIVPLVRNDAHMMIEECMILANVAAANFVQDHDGHALYRVHDAPGDEKLVDFRRFLAELGLQLGGGDTPQPKDYAALAKEVRQRPDHELIQTMLLRSMKQAVYEPDCRGHFGLALTAYAHFTSPIRRYPDLVLHRTIKALLGKTGRKGRDWVQRRGGWHYQAEEMPGLGEHCSMTERRADDATREVNDWLKCEYMQDHVGDTFSGVISTVTGFGFFVRLDDLHIDGLVHISNLRGDYYHFDPVHQALRGEGSGIRYRLGDPIEVTVAAVNLDDRKIDFLLTDQGVKPDRRGRAKTRVAVDKAAGKTKGKAGKKAAGKKDGKKAAAKKSTGKKSTGKKKGGGNKPAAGAEAQAAAKKASKKRKGKKKPAQQSR